MARFFTNAQNYGKFILYRGWRDGQRQHFKDEFSPELFVSAKGESKYKTLYGKSVEPVSFTDIREAKDFIKTYEGVEGFEVFGQTQFQYQYLAVQFPGEIEYDISQMSIWSCDIETSTDWGFPDLDTANEAILLISIHDKNKDKVITFGWKPWENTDEKVTYRCFKDESTMLREFVMFWNVNAPDIVTGWNIDQFDIPYMIKRIARVLDEDWVKKLSPWGYIQEKTTKIRGKDTVIYDIIGITMLDYMSLYKNYTYSAQESYALDFIAELELGENKLDHSEWGSFKEFYSGDFDVFEEPEDTVSEIKKMGYQRTQMKLELQRRGISVD
jgi:DNA polymerase elongation subunit (family B)